MKETIEMALKKTEESWQKSLKGGNEEEVLKTLAKIAENGSINLLEDVIFQRAFSKSSKVKLETQKVLENLKVSGAEDIFFKCFKKEEYKPIMQPLLSAFWLSNLDASGKLEDLISIALKSNDYLIGFECLTIIENNPSGFEENELIHSIQEIQSYLEMNHPQKDLLENIREALSNQLTDR